MIILGLIIIAVMVLMPYKMFWAVWIGPFVVMTGILLKLNIWNPFTDIAEGNWNDGVLIGLASFANGVLWEFWNYGSSHPVDPVTNPNYWVYNIPYVMGDAFVGTTMFGEKPTEAATRTLLARLESSSTSSSCKIGLTGSVTDEVGG